MRLRITAVLLSIMPVVAFAHHSFAMFDMQKDVSLNGTVKSFNWESPHSWLQVVVRNSTGEDKEWSLEMGAPSSLYRSGWRQASVKPGDRVTVVVHPLRDGRSGGSLVSIVLPNGTRLGAFGASAAPAPTPAPESGATP
jgi:hypothetical protein